jgi:hypothetical protein
MASNILPPTDRLPHLPHLQNAPYFRIHTHLHGSAADMVHMHRRRTQRVRDRHKRRRRLGGDTRQPRDRRAQRIPYRVGQPRVQSRRQVEQGRGGRGQRPLVRVVDEACSAEVEIKLLINRWRQLILCAHLGVNTPRESGLCGGQAAVRSRAPQRASSRCTAQRSRAGTRLQRR